MFVFTYIADQPEPDGRPHPALHDQRNVRRRVVLFNVIYQKNLDVLDAPFQIQPGVAHSNRRPTSSTSGTTPTTRTPPSGSTRSTTYLAVRVLQRHAPDLPEHLRSACARRASFSAELAVQPERRRHAVRRVCRQPRLSSASTTRRRRACRFARSRSTTPRLTTSAPACTSTGCTARAATCTWSTTGSSARGLPHEHVFSPTDRQVVVKMTYMLAR